MNRIVVVFCGFLLALLGLWLLADTPWPAPEYFALRKVWVQLTGVLAIGVMSLALLLATRPMWLEPMLGGLDKLYRLHKWLGITALVVATLHWLLARGTKWAVGWGWLVRPERGPKPQLEPGTLEATLRGWRGTAESLGEWAFYLVAVLLVLALVKRFPYRPFRATHRWIALAWLVLAFHAMVLVEYRYWTQPVGWAVAALLVAGTVSALWSLARRIGATRTAYGTIEALQRYPSLRVIEASLRMDEGWKGHTPGQFAFAMSDPDEGPHPYTAASAWDPDDRRITFIVKELGDHTRRLPERLKLGQRVRLEGPYGGFTFGDDRPRQVWVGAGIGITPFIARMKYLARHRAHDPRPVDLFHSTHGIDAEALARLRADAEAAGVRLHLFDSSEGERLDGDRLRARVPDWREASVWFCGPTGFARTLQADLVAHGLPARDFHRELFELR